MQSEKVKSHSVDTTGTSIVDDATSLIERYQTLFADIQRLRRRLDELGRVEGRLLDALRRSGVSYRRLARALASKLALAKTGSELRKLTQRLRQQRRRHVARENKTSARQATDAAQVGPARGTVEVSDGRTELGRRRPSRP